MPLVYLDGKLVEKEDAKVSVYDHGLLYGDGVFEGIRVYRGEVFKLTEHLDRLYDSAKTIMLTIPLAKEDFAEAIKSTVKANGMEEAYIRAVVTRGAGTLGLNPRKCPSPSVIIIVDTIALYPDEFYENGLKLITVPTERVHRSALSSQVKSLNYLNNIMAKIEALNADLEEAVMLNREGYVAECTGDNIFLVKDATLYTPGTGAGILEGITRGVVIDLAAERGYETRESDSLTRYDLYVADECFLTGTAAEVIPVVTIDERIIGAGSPGLITLELLAAFRELTKGA